MLASFLTVVDNAFVLPFQIVFNAVKESQDIIVINAIMDTEDKCKLEMMFVNWLKKNNSEKVIETENIFIL